MDTSEYDRQQPWLLKFEDPPQLHVSTSQAYPWAPSKIPILPNSQTLQEVTGMTYGPNTDDPEGDDKVQPWLISDAPIQSCKPHPPLSQDPVLWDDYVSSCDWDRGNKPFNPEAASFQPRQPSSGHETTHPQKLEVTVINAHYFRGSPADVDIDPEPQLNKDASLGNHAQQHFQPAPSISSIPQLEQRKPVGYYDETGLFVINQAIPSRLSKQSSAALSTIPEFHIVKPGDPQGEISGPDTTLSKEFAAKDPKCKYPHPLWVACIICGPPQQVDFSVPTLPESVWRRSLQSTIHESSCIDTPPAQEWPGIISQWGSPKPSGNLIHKPAQTLPAVAVDEKTAAAFRRARGAFQDLPEDEAGPTFPSYVYRPNPLLRTRDYENKNNSMNLQDEDFYCRVKELQYQMARKPPPDLSRISSSVFQADTKDLPTPPVENPKGCLWMSHSVPLVMHENLGGNRGEQRKITAIAAEGTMVTPPAPPTPIEPNPEAFAVPTARGKPGTLKNQSQMEGEAPSQDHQLEVDCEW